MAEGRFDNPIIAALAGFWDFIRKQDLADRLSESDRIDGKNCLVTGASSGLGFALAVELARRGGRVIMACRSHIPEAGEKVKQKSGSGLVVMRYLDLADIKSIHAFCDWLMAENQQLDITILNAGVALPLARKTPSGLEEMFMVNYLSNVILTSQLLQDGTIPNDSLAGSKGRSQSRIIFISSDSHQGASYVDYSEFGIYTDYGVSKGMEYYSYYKLVSNTYFTELSRRINDEKVDVGIHVICPGPVHTNIIREAPRLLRIILKIIFYIIFRSPAKAAKPVIYMSLSEDYRNRTNEYLHMFNKKKMDPKVYEVEEGKKLWKKTYQLWKKIDSRAFIPDLGD